MINALTVDVEDYWSIFRRDWLKESGARPCEAVIRNTSWLLALLSERNVNATFFFLGEVAEKYPELVQDVVREGHEVGVHGFYHNPVFKLSRTQFRQEIGRAKHLLEDITGSKVLGHRAPFFSLNSDTEWAFEVLVELGFVYDSSIVPSWSKAANPMYPNTNIHTIKLGSGRKIIEVPNSGYKFCGKNITVGGGYFRHFPYLCTRIVMKSIQRNRSVVFYTHPYEFDLQKKDFDMSHLSRGNAFAARRFHAVQQRGRATLRRKLFKLLDEFDFTSVGNIISLNASTIEFDFHPALEFDQ